MGVLDSTPPPIPHPHPHPTCCSFLWKPLFVTGLEDVPNCANFALVKAQSSKAGSLESLHDTLLTIHMLPSARIACMQQTSVLHTETLESQGTCGLVAMTSASHAEGRQFDPGQVYMPMSLVHAPGALEAVDSNNLALLKLCCAHKFFPPSIGSCNKYRSHFGSRYTSGCCASAGLFLTRFKSPFQHGILQIPIWKPSPRSKRSSAKQQLGTSEALVCSQVLPPKHWKQ